MPKALSGSEKDLIVSEYLGGMTYHEIRDKYKKSVNTIGKYLKEAGVNKLKTWAGLSDEERFLSHIKKTDYCWEWLDGKASGYGLFFAGGRRWAAHAYAYKIWVGPIPFGLEIDHVCHNLDIDCVGGSGCLHRKCVNPEHLEPVSHRINVLRGQGLAAFNAGKTHCIRGHDLSGHNLVIQKGKHRQCRVCKNMLNREEKRRNKIRSQNGQ